MRFKNSEQCHTGFSTVGAVTHGHRAYVMCVPRVQVRTVLLLAVNHYAHRRRYYVGMCFVYYTYARARTYLLRGKRFL